MFSKHLINALFIKKKMKKSYNLDVSSKRVFFLTRTFFNETHFQVFFFLQKKLL